MLHHPTLVSTSLIYKYHVYLIVLPCICDGPLHSLHFSGKYTYKMFLTFCLIFRWDGLGKKIPILCLGKYDTCQDLPFCATNRKSLVQSQLVLLEFFIDIKSFRSHYGPGVDSASNRNEYQEHFLGVKVAGA